MKLTARGIPVITIPFVFALALPVMAQTLAITDVESLALKNSPDAKIAGLNYETGRSKYAAAESSLRPSVSLSSLGTSISGSDKADSSVVSSPSAGITIRQPLGQLLPDTFATTSGLDWMAAKNDWLSTQLKDRQAAWNLRYQARTAYVNVLKAQAALDLSREQLKQIETSLLPEANAKLNAGIATRVDVLRVEAQLGNAKLAVMKNQNILINAQRNLARLLGQEEIGADLTLAPLPEVDGSTPLPSLREVQGIALNRRLEIQLSKILLEAARASADKLKLSSSPVFSLGTTISETWQDQDLTLSARSEINSRDMEIAGSVNASQPKDPRDGGLSWNINLGVSMPILDWGQSRQAKIQSENSLKIAEMNLEQSKTDILTDVEQAYNGLIEARERLAYAKLSQSTAETTLDITRTRYNAKVASTSELIDSEVAAYEARSSVTQAVYDLFLAADQLTKAIGPEAENGSERSGAR